MLQTKRFCKIKRDNLEKIVKQKVATFWDQKLLQLLNVQNNKLLNAESLKQTHKLLSESVQVTTLYRNLHTATRRCDQ